MAKKKLIAKIHQETGIESADLERLPVDALDKIDLLVPDTNLDDDLLGHQDNTPVLAGYHPVTGAEIWN